ncbi:ATP-binding cassette sub-family G member 4-like isoform X2 [Belonocnema kinseyi]|nr:ATP-binding cassette sub-family G member 4-like isoform X2 [Belonocnema kinseyi]
MVNGADRDLTAFRRSSVYIMQDDNLQPLLTVQEAMDVAANLKLNTSCSEKNRNIDQILVAMGLAKSKNTRTGKLSGGQRKRLAIALELINNPPIMFFDEPTSGLDSVSSKQCLALLKFLAREGRTVICTIHQPSASLFDMIDHLYVVARGSCVYTGGTQNLVNFLTLSKLYCPTYHNPADFVLEICNGDYGDHVEKLIKAIENGKNNHWRSPANDDFSKMKAIIDANLMTPVRAPNLPPPKELVQRRMKGKNYALHATGFWTQLYVLLKRNAIKLSRDRVLTYMRISMHFWIAILVGTLNFKIGEDANYAFDNYNLLFFSVMFLMFSSFSATLITFPLEVPVLAREHFNRWYKLRSFYLANKLADFPLQITATFIYTLIVYYMSGQVLEVKRLFLYVLICIAISLVAQNIGLIIGIVMNIQNGVIFGPLIILPFTIFSGFFVHLHDAQPYLQWLFHISFLKYGFEGIMAAIYGYDRLKMKCSKDYCHFAYPSKLLQEVGMKHVEYWYNIVMLVVFYIILDTSAFLLLRLRLKQRFNR